MMGWEGVDVLGSVFISYRRDDSAGFPGRIYDRLTKSLRHAHFFLDVDNIPAGLDFGDVPALRDPTPRATSTSAFRVRRGDFSRTGCVALTFVAPSARPR
jgi:hypothetical protein